MQPFSYMRPSSVEGAVAALHRYPGAQCIAGGTNLLDLMKLQVMTPSVLVDVTLLPLKQVEAREGGLYIGALVANSDLAEDERIKRDYPLLSQALLAGASPQLRNMATVGGNLLQRTRCVYFTDGHSACNKRQPGSGCAALEGFHRMHAVLGTSSQCIAVHPSDMSVALAALDAKVHVIGPRGERVIALTEFHRVPGGTPERETQLEPDELILGVHLPAPVPGQLVSYVKVRDRASYAFALVAAGVLLTRVDQKIRTARIALGGVGTKPWRAPVAERVLLGTDATHASFANAAEAALEGAKPLRDNQFKIELAKRTLRLALAQAARLDDPYGVDGDELWSH